MPPFQRYTPQGLIVAIRPEGPVYRPKRRIRVAVCSVASAVDRVATPELTIKPRDENAHP